MLFTVVDNLAAGERQIHLGRTNLLCRALKNVSVDDGQSLPAASVTPAASSAVTERFRSFGGMNDSPELSVA